MLLGDYVSEYEVFECQTGGVISDSIVQNWTRSALECYKLGCDCSLCPINHAGYSFKCQMKYIVDELLKTKGLPDEKEILNMQNYPTTGIAEPIIPEDIVA